MQPGAGTVPCAWGAQVLQVTDDYVICERFLSTLSLTLNQFIKLEKQTLITVKINYIHEFSLDIFMYVKLGQYRDNKNQKHLNIW